MAEPDPAAIVRAALRAARDRDVNAALEVFAPDCDLRLAQGSFMGHDGVREFFVTRSGDDGGPRSGEPEHVGDGIVLVPVTFDGAGDGAPEVLGTSIWTVRGDQIGEVHGVPGGRRSALRSLGREA